MSTEIRTAVDFYERHPISCEIILAKLKASRGHLDGLTPDELFPHDQDHYGGLAANDVLAARAGIGEGTLVADFCAGLGGPSRYFAHRYGADVTGIELTPARVKGAEDFSYMLEARPGAFIFCGNGNTAGLHHPAYNFNDEAIVFGTSYWIKLVENTLAA